MDFLRYMVYNSKLSGFTMRLKRSFRLRVGPTKKIIAVLHIIVTRRTNETGGETGFRGNIFNRF